MLLFRQSQSDVMNYHATAEEMQANQKKWGDWVGSIESRGKLASNGPALAPIGKVLKPGGEIIDGPFVEVKEMLWNSITIKADSLEEAVSIAKDCPALNVDGSVEVRPVFS